MSNEEVITSHSMTVRFDLLPGNEVRWYAIPDKEGKVAHGFSPAELVRLGAPLSLLGIKALFKMCCDGLIVNALDQASLFQREFRQPEPPEGEVADLPCLEESTAIH